MGETVLATSPTVRARARSNILRSTVLRSTVFKAVAGVLAVTTATLFGGLAPASAAVGDSSSARGQFLSGSLLGTPLPVTLVGSTASSDGTADDMETSSLTWRC